MRRPVFSFRPNMEQADHRKAWEILRQVPEGQKNLFLVRAILNEHHAKYLEGIIRETVREELKGYRTECISGGNGVFLSEHQKEASEVPDQVLDFITMLQEE